RLLARSRAFHTNAREAPRPQGRLPRGDRVAAGLDRRRRARAARRHADQERLWPLLARPARSLVNVIETELPGVKIIEPRVHGDGRGFFVETFQAKRYAEAAGIDLPFVQDNHSRSRRGVLHG